MVEETAIMSIEDNGTPHLHVHSPILVRMQLNQRDKMYTMIFHDAH